MDTKTLVVGQDVYMVSGVYLDQGKVVRITTSGLDVQAVHGGLVRFDSDGKECDGGGTYECGPWELVEPPPLTAALWERRFEK